MGEFRTHDSKEDMEQAFANTDAFNDKLHTKAYRVFADDYRVFPGGPQSASTATLVNGQT